MDKSQQVASWLNGLSVEGQDDGGHKLALARPLLITEIYAPPGYAIDAEAAQEGVLRFVKNRTPADDINRFVPHPDSISVTAQGVR